MFVIGGHDIDQDMPELGKETKDGVCDPGEFVNVLDVNTFAWDARYDPQDVGDYLVHESIYHLIGGK